MTDEEGRKVLAMIREMRVEFVRETGEILATLGEITDDVRGVNDTIGAIDAHLSGCRLTAERTLRVLRGGKR